MEFEYDPDKSIANEDKHGINFTYAQSLWGDPNRVEVPARTDDEPRWVVIGSIADVKYAAVVTYRSGRVRLISVRRARQEEVEIYES